MGMQQSLVDKLQKLTDKLGENVSYYFVIGIGLLLGLIFFLCSPNSVELGCTRSSLGILECRLERNTPLLKMNAIKIFEPLAVDVVEHYDSGSFPFYDVEMRSKQYSFNFKIIATRNDKKAQKVAKEVNDFLLRSDQTSFSGVYP